MPLTFDKQLQNYADLVIRVGLNLQKGQRLFIRSVLEGADFTRLVVDRAYKAGASHVDVFWSDDALMLSRFNHAPKDSFGFVPSWYKEAFNHELKPGDALLSIRAADPELLKHQDPTSVAAYERASRLELKPLMNKIMSSEVNWCLVSVPVQGWAAKLFPNHKPEKQMQKLWTAILKTVRANESNAVAKWKIHLKTLQKRRAYLSNKQYSALKYKALGTDLTIGLASNHIWLGGRQDAQNGITYVANLPTEEVFTAPHKDHAEGVVCSTKPLSYAGNLIDGFELTFKKGQVIKAKAKKGEKLLHKLLETDEGARRLGEVALVPHSSPISQSGLLYLHTLFDENASSHVALGNAYRFNVQGGTKMTAKQAAKAGINSSLTHVDFMIGSENMDIDGVTKEGKLEVVMRQGEWAF
jgi:aminopeptidase